MKRIKKHPILSSILAAEMTGLFIVCLLEANIINVLKNIPYVILLSTLLGIFLCYPFILTGINILFTVAKVRNSRWHKVGKCFEYITLILGFAYSCLLPGLYQVNLAEDWMIALRNTEVHTPVFTETYTTIIGIAVIGIVGYLLLNFIPLKKMPPLIIVTSISAMYLGIFECIVWMIQVWALDYIFMILLPLNCIIIAIKVIKTKIDEWNQIQDEENRTYQYTLFNRMNQRLVNSKKWPMMAFLMMWPLLGILICILVLFGQQPDSIIKAWTETSDWNLSQRIAPQNVQFDEHYLCTVAAGGHPKVVKPLRLGMRHGHQVIVNRQLCVANAFEQILEEKIPVLHKHIRNFYDTYGYPISRKIRSSYMADLIYFLMKPLEWFFLIVIYFCDIKPENRIAIQYMPRTKRDISAQ